MLTGIDRAADGTATLPTRGVTGLRKLARLERWVEKQIQREHLDLMTEDTLRKNNERRQNTIPDYVNRGEKKEGEVDTTSGKKGEDALGEEEERKTITV